MLSLLHRSLPPAAIAVDAYEKEDNASLEIVSNDLSTQNTLELVCGDPLQVVGSLQVHIYLDDFMRVYRMDNFYKSNM